MTRRPFPQSFWVHDGLLCAGCYPGDLDPAIRDDKLRGLLDAGIRRVLNLMEADETSHGGRPFEPYVPRLQELAAGRGVEVDVLGLPIRDAFAPTPEAMREILDTIERGLQECTPTYLHCWGGHGRTSTVVACHLIERGRSPRQALEAIRVWRDPLPKNHDPFEGDQRGFVLAWADRSRPYG